MLAGFGLLACGKAPPVGDDAGFDAGPVCLDSDSGVADAGPGDGGDFSCLGQPLPTVAVAQLDLGGFVTAAGLSRTPVEGALIELMDPSGSVVASAVSGTDGGRYAVSTAIGCAPYAGSMRASKPDAGFSDNWYYPSAPWRMSRSSLELVIFDGAAQTLVAGIAGVTVQPGTGALALGVDDCAGRPMSGATVTTSPAGTVRYVSALGFPSATETATTGKGQLIVFNVPPGMVELNAMAAGQTLRSKRVLVHENAITSTTLTP